MFETSFHLPNTQSRHHALPSSHPYKIVKQGCIVLVSSSTSSVFHKSGPQSKVDRYPTHLASRAHLDETTNFVFAEFSVDLPLEDERTGVPGLFLESGHGSCRSVSIWVSFLWLTTQPDIMIDTSTLTASKRNIAENNCDAGNDR